MATVAASTLAHAGDVSSGATNAAVALTQQAAGVRDEALAAQEAKLRDHPLLRRFAESRRKLAADPYRPLYHFVSPESTMNDPNGLCFWNGRWHLFYQACPPENLNQHWGHTVSDDLIHWRDLPYAIKPGPENCCYSGSTLVESNRVIAMYHGTGQGNMVAIASDPLLLDLEKLTGKAVIPSAGAPCTIFDPCIWKKDGVYYSLSGGTLPQGPRRPAEFLFKSTDLVKWEYLHPFVEGDVFSLVGRNELGMEPAGDIASLRGAHRHIDETALPANREVVLEGVQGNALEITAELDLRKSPMVELNVLRSPGKEEFTRIAFFKHRGYQNWDRFKDWNKWFETCDSLITLDTAYSSTLPDATSRAPESAPVWLAPDEPLKLRVFIDKSVVEVFVNGRQCVAARVYPGRADSLGVSLRAQGNDAVLKQLDAWTMKSIYAE